jgi:hypothetical protein
VGLSGFFQLADATLNPGQHVLDLHDVALQFKNELSQLIK